MTPRLIQRNAPGAPLASMVETMEDAMPAETLAFLALVVIAFGGFAATLAWVDHSTREVRQKNHPIPGE